MEVELSGIYMIDDAIDKGVFERFLFGNAAGADTTGAAIARCDFLWSWWWSGCMNRFLKRDIVLKRGAFLLARFWIGIGIYFGGCIDRCLDYLCFFARESPRGIVDADSR